MQDERTLGELTEECNGQAIRQWLDARRSGRSTEEMLTSHLLNREIIILRDDRKHRITVFVTVRGYRGTPSDTFFWTYARTRESAWRLVDTTSNGR
jgi:hypothetical protein